LYRSTKSANSRSPVPCAGSYISRGHASTYHSSAATATSRIDPNTVATNRTVLPPARVGRQNARTSITGPSATPATATSSVSPYTR
jgi:hypothetical protein